MEKAFDLLRMVSHVIESVEERATKILRSFKEPIVCDMLARVMPDSFGRIQFRPVGRKLEDFHVTTVRLEPGHVFCCMLSLKLSREVERRLREQFGTTDSNPHAITLRDALTSLASLCLMQYQVDEKTTVTKLPQPSANQPKILTALAVPLPKKM